jgi:hypothetical protein
MESKWGRLKSERYRNKRDNGSNLQILIYDIINGSVNIL